MATALSIFGVAFAALCVWLGIRIFNRRERWAKWTAVGVGLLVLYPLSFGPACWISSRVNFESRVFSAFYRPVAWTFSDSQDGEVHPIGGIFLMYALIGSANDFQWYSVPSVTKTADGDFTIAQTVQWCSTKSANDAESALDAAEDAILDAGENAPDGPAIR